MYDSGDSGYGGYDFDPTLDSYPVSSGLSDYQNASLGSFDPGPLDVGNFDPGYGGAYTPENPDPGIPTFDPNLVSDGGLSDPWAGVPMDSAPNFEYPSGDPNPVFTGDGSLDAGSGGDPTAALLHSNEGYAGDFEFPQFDANSLASIPDIDPTSLTFSSDLPVNEVYQEVLQLDLVHDGGAYYAMSYEDTVNQALQAPGYVHSDSSGNDSGVTLGSVEAPHTDVYPLEDSAGGGDPIKAALLGDNGYGGGADSASDAAAAGGGDPIKAALLGDNGYGGSVDGSAAIDAATGGGDPTKAALFGEVGYGGDSNQAAIDAGTSAGDPTKAALYGDEGYGPAPNPSASNEELQVPQLGKNPQIQLNGQQSDFVKDTPAEAEIQEAKSDLQREVNRIKAQYAQDVSDLQGQQASQANLRDTVVNTIEGPNGSAQAVIDSVLGGQIYNDQGGLTTDEQGSVLDDVADYAKMSPAQREAFVAENRDYLADLRAESDDLQAQAQENSQQYQTLRSKYVEELAATGGADNETTISLREQLDQIAARGEQINADILDNNSELKITAASISAANILDTKELAAGLVIQANSEGNAARQEALLDSYRQANANIAAAAATAANRVENSIANEQQRQIEAAQAAQAAAQQASLTAQNQAALSADNAQSYGPLPGNSGLPSFDSNSSMGPGDSNYQPSALSRFVGGVGDALTTAVENTQNFADRVKEVGLVQATTEVAERRTQELTEAAGQAGNVVGNTVRVIDTVRGAGTAQDTTDLSNAVGNVPTAVKTVVEGFVDKYKQVENSIRISDGSPEGTFVDPARTLQALAQPVATSIRDSAEGSINRIGEVYQNEGLPAASVEVGSTIVGGLSNLLVEPAVKGLETLQQDNPNIVDAAGGVAQVGLTVAGVVPFFRGGSAAVEGLAGRAAAGGEDIVADGLAAGGSRAGEVAVGGTRIEPVLGDAADLARPIDSVLGSNVDDIGAVTTELPKGFEIPVSSATPENVPVILRPATGEGDIYGFNTSLRQYSTEDLSRIVQDPTYAREVAGELNVIKPEVLQRDAAAILGRVESPDLVAGVPATAEQMAQQAELIGLKVSNVPEAYRFDTRSLSDIAQDGGVLPNPAKPAGTLVEHTDSAGTGNYVSFSRGSAVDGSATNDLQNLVANVTKENGAPKVIESPVPLHPDPVVTPFSEVRAVNQQGVVVDGGKSLFSEGEVVFPEVPNSALEGRTAEYVQTYKETVQMGADGTPKYVYTLNPTGEVHATSEFRPLSDFATAKTEAAAANDAVVLGELNKPPQVPASTVTLENAGAPHTADLHTPVFRDPVYASPEVSPSVPSQGRQIPVELQGVKVGDAPTASSLSAVQTSAETNSLADIGAKYEQLVSSLKSDDIIVSELSNAEIRKLTGDSTMRGAFYVDDAGRPNIFIAASDTATSKYETLLHELSHKTDYFNPTKSAGSSLIEINSDAGKLQVPNYSNFVSASEGKSHTVQFAAEKQVAGAYLNAKDFDAAQAVANRMSETISVRDGLYKELDDSITRVESALTNPQGIKISEGDTAGLQRYTVTVQGADGSAKDVSFILKEGLSQDQAALEIKNTIAEARLDVQSGQARLAKDIDYYNALNEEIRLLKNPEATARVASDNLATSSSTGAIPVKPAVSAQIDREVSSMTDQNFTANYVNLTSRLNQEGVNVQVVSRGSAQLNGADSALAMEAGHPTLYVSNDLNSVQRLDAAVEQSANLTERLARQAGAFDSVQTSQAVINGTQDFFVQRAVAVGYIQSGDTEGLSSILKEMQSNIESRSAVLQEVKQSMLSTSEAVKNPSNVQILGADGSGMQKYALTVKNADGTVQSVSYTLKPGLTQEQAAAQIAERVNSNASFYSTYETQLQRDLDLLNGYRSRG